MASKFPAMEDIKIAVIGLGYVGLPLAVEFSKQFKTIGFDTKVDRIRALKQGVDNTLEISKAELVDASDLTLTSDPADLASATFFVVTVPTPIDASKQPDLSALYAASKTVGKQLKKGDVVVYESTVYPGATEDDCAPILAEHSDLTLNEDFWLGYSPERINPGDKLHKLPDILKVTSGSTPDAASFIDAVYKQIIPAGTHMAKSIRVAEAAKVIENTQRDINIALVNELAIIFNKMGIDTNDVLRAAGTKWNFLPFRPGLVGGHCIGVDPYYLTHKAQLMGHHPEIILAGRRLNDEMGIYAAGCMIKAMLKAGISVTSSKLLVMGLTFKENCPDLRNTKVVDLIKELESFGIDVSVYDPWIDGAEAEALYGIKVVAEPSKATYDGIVLAVAHDQFKSMEPSEIKGLMRKAHVIYDLKNMLPAGQATLTL